MVTCNAECIELVEGSDAIRQLECANAPSGVLRAAGSSKTGLMSQLPDEFKRADVIFLIVSLVFIIAFSALSCLCLKKSNYKVMFFACCAINSITLLLGITGLTGCVFILMRSASDR